ncbi:hypothetical protein [Streptomyces sp. NPDC058773]|uniref:hypothetical protein n=1 Tax=Streptomyces sp. NPDC058773 TaxID=3346632 RepID=UPI0036C426CF
MSGDTDLAHLEWWAHSSTCLGLSPRFTLRFKDDAVVEVAVDHSGDPGHLRLRAAPDVERTMTS